MWYGNIREACHCQHTTVSCFDIWHSYVTALMLCIPLLVTVGGITVDSRAVTVHGIGSFLPFLFSTENCSGMFLKIQPELHFDKCPIQPGALYAF